MDMIRVIVNRSLALREGVDERRALTLGLVGAMIGPPIAGYVVTMALAKKEAPEPVVVGGTTGSGPVVPGDGTQPSDVAGGGGDAVRRTRNDVRGRDRHREEPVVSPAIATAPADTLGSPSPKTHSSPKG